MVLLLLLLNNKITLIPNRYCHLNPGPGPQRTTTPLLHYTTMQCIAMGVEYALGITLAALLHSAVHNSATADGSVSPGLEFWPKFVTFLKKLESLCD